MVRAEIPPVLAFEVVVSAEFLGGGDGPAPHLHVPGHDEQRAPMAPTPALVAYRLTRVERASALIRRVRAESGLSIRAVAERAQVAASTVSRIEAGRVDPGVETLGSLLAAMGYELELMARCRASVRVAGLCDALSLGPQGQRLDWTRLRFFLDHLARHPLETAAAIEEQPAPSGSAVLDNTLAAIAEKLADDAGLARPNWTVAVEPLSQETFPAPLTPLMRATVQRATPAQFAARRLFIDAGSLWRKEAARAS